MLRGIRKPVIPEGVIRGKAIMSGGIPAMRTEGLPEAPRGRPAIPEGLPEIPYGKTVISEEIRGIPRGNPAMSEEIPGTADGKPAMPGEIPEVLYGSQAFPEGIPGILRGRQGMTGGLRRPAAVPAISGGKTPGPSIRETCGRIRRAGDREQVRSGIPRSGDACRESEKSVPRKSVSRRWSLSFA